MKTRLLRELTDKASDDHYNWFMEHVFGPDANVVVADWTETLKGRDICDYAQLEKGELRAYMMKAMWDVDKNSIREKYSKYTRYSKELRRGRNCVRLCLLVGGSICYNI